jgi:hypothetical protein
MKKQDIEICAIQLKTQSKFVIILCLFRAPSGNLRNFLKTLEKILAKLNKAKNEFVICGDTNINFAEMINNKTTLINLLKTYNLVHTVYFPTRLTDRSATSIDNIFIDADRSHFINTYLQYFNACFVTRKARVEHKRDQWITRGIKISTRRKKELYLLSRLTNSQILINHYKKYCKILSTVIFAAKRLYFSKLIQNSDNKTKSAWNIVTKENGHFKCKSDIQRLNFNNNTITNQQEIATIFNNYFLTIADTINTNNNNKNDKKGNQQGQYSSNFPTKEINKMNWKYVTTHEIEKTIRTLKTKNSYGFDEIPNKTIKISCFL